MPAPSSHTLTAFLHACTIVVEVPTRPARDGDPAGYHAQVDCHAAAVPAALLGQVGREVRFVENKAEQAQA